MKRVLIIIYYWPPTSGSGVQRWLKFTKHLRSYGWEPIIYTPENPYIHEQDETLMKDIPDGIEVIRQPVFEVARYFGMPDKSVSGVGNVKTSIVSTIKKHIGNYVRGNLFIPDARISWVRPSVNYLLQYLKTNKVDAIVSSGPPHSLHLIAQNVTAKLGIPWLADFRDPWFEILNFHNFSISASAYKKYEGLYKKVIQQADVNVVAQGTVQHSFQQHTPKPVTLITNGYDKDDMQPDGNVQLDQSKFNLVFVGIFYAKRNPEAFWQALRQLIDEDAAFAAKCRLVFVGKGQNDVMRDVVKYNLAEYCHFTGYISHGSAVAYQMQASGLLLFTGIEPSFRHDVPGKLFEYLAAKRHIICIGQPGSDAADIVTKTKAGYTVSYNNKEEIKAAIKQVYQKCMSGNIVAHTENYEQYERKMLTKRMANELNRITSVYK